MTTLFKLNLAYVRATDDARRCGLLEAIDAILADARCPACGEPIEEGDSCWNIHCPEGRENIDAETADRQHHASVDRALEDAYFLGHDL